VSDRSSPTIDIVAVEQDGGPVVLHACLSHGQDPHELLADAGWLVQELLDVDSTAMGGLIRDIHRLTFSFLVTAAAHTGHAGRSGPFSSGLTAVHDPGLAVADGEAPVMRQRVAAYVLVTGERGILLTQFSDRTNAPRTWGLPGGGIEPGEHPRDAVVRETWEETGQHVRVSALAGVRTSHWVGRAPHGLLEDFHAVRVLFRGTCPTPVDAVVHDVAEPPSRPHGSIQQP